MANAKADPSIYYIPHNGWYPIGVAFGAMVMLTGFATYLNDVKGGADGSWVQFYTGLAVLSITLFFWFAKVIEEREKAKKEKKETQEQNTLNVTESMPPSTGQEEKPDIDEDIVFAGEVDIIDLIAQRKDITDSKV